MGNQIVYAICYSDYDSDTIHVVFSDREVALRHARAWEDVREIEFDPTDWFIPEDGMSLYDVHALCTYGDKKWYFTPASISKEDKYDNGWHKVNDTGKIVAGFNFFTRVWAHSCKEVETIVLARITSIESAGLLSHDATYHFTTDETGKIIAERIATSEDVNG